jgi:hypothetical protein
MNTLSKFLISETLKPYFEKANVIRALNVKWSIIMHDFLSHCKIVSFERGQLVLEVENSDLAKQVQDAAPEIIEILSRHLEFMSVMAIQCTVSPPLLQEPTINRTKSKLGSGLLNRISEDTEDPLLKASLSKLAATLSVF